MMVLTPLLVVTIPNLSLVTISIVCAFMFAKQSYHNASMDNNIAIRYDFSIIYQYRIWLISEANIGNDYSSKLKFTKFLHYLYTHNVQGDQ